MIGAGFSPEGRRSAVTLLEVLLVLCLLVVLATLTWLALDRPMATQRLRKAAEFLRAEWGRARVESMSSSKTYIFRYTPGSGQYSIECSAGPEFTPDSELDAELAVSGEDGQAPAVLPKSGRSLPEGVTFALGETAFDTRAQTVPSEAELLPATEPIASEPILFYPDGTTSTARLLLKNEHGRTIELSLRGLTGVVTVGETRSAEGQLP